MSRLVTRLLEVVRECVSMMTADQCRGKAAEAEALARIVSLHTDKTRLMTMAADWRRRACELDGTAANSAALRSAQWPEKP